MKIINIIAYGFFCLFVLVVLVSAIDVLMRKKEVIAHLVQVPREEAIVLIEKQLVKASVYLMEMETLNIYVPEKYIMDKLLRYMDEWEGYTSFDRFYMQYIYGRHENTGKIITCTTIVILGAACLSEGNSNVERQ